MSIRRKWADYYDLPEISKIREHILETFNNKLQFIEETHQYFLDGIEYECVSNVTHRFKDFDKEAVLDMCAEKAKWDINYKYYDDEFIYSSGVLPLTNCF